MTIAAATPAAAAIGTMIESSRDILLRRRGDDVLSLVVFKVVFGFVMRGDMTISVTVSFGPPVGGVGRVAGVPGIFFAKYNGVAGIGHTVQIPGVNEFKEIWRKVRVVHELGIGVRIHLVEIGRILSVMIASIHNEGDQPLSLVVHLGPSF